MLLFWLKMHENQLAAEMRPDPLGSLQHSTRLLADLEKEPVAVLFQFQCCISVIC